MSETDKPIKVVDRRLFTADGDVREESQAELAAPDPAPEPALPRRPRPRRPSRRRPRARRSSAFSTCSRRRRRFTWKDFPTPRRAAARSISPGPGRSSIPSSRFARRRAGAFRSRRPTRSKGSSGSSSSRSRGSRAPPSRSLRCRLPRRGEAEVLRDVSAGRAPHGPAPVRPRVSPRRPRLFALLPAVPARAQVLVAPGESSETAFRKLVRGHWFAWLGALEEGDAPLARAKVDEILKHAQKIEIRRMTDLSLSATLLGRRELAAGKREIAREAFTAAMRLDPGSSRAALGAPVARGLVAAPGAISSRTSLGALRATFADAESRRVVLVRLVLIFLLTACAAALAAIVVLLVRHGPRLVHDLQGVGRRDPPRARAGARRRGVSRRRPSSSRSTCSGSPCSCSSFSSATRAWSRRSRRASRSPSRSSSCRRWTGSPTTSRSRRRRSCARPRRSRSPATTSASSTTSRRPRTSCPTTWTSVSCSDASTSRWARTTARSPSTRRARTSPRATSGASSIAATSGSWTAISAPRRRTTRRP